MKTWIQLQLIILFLLHLLLVPVSTKTQESHKTNALIDTQSEQICILCVSGVMIFQNYARDYQNNSYDQALIHICDNFSKTSSLDHICQAVTSLFGQKLVDMLTSSSSSDNNNIIREKFCENLQFCSGKCRLYEEPTFVQIPQKEENCEQITTKNLKSGINFKNSNENSNSKAVVDMWWSKIREVYNSHESISEADLDHDGFSSSKFKTFRGTDWNGCDCDEKNPEIYPGRKINPSNDTIDYSCNGISGIDPTTNTSYNSLFCDSVPNRRGLLVLGDSATARFRIPETLLEPFGLNEAAAIAFEKLIENELDFPQYSWASGQHSSILPEDAPLISWKGPKLVSIYQEMLSRNRCMKQDFRNFAINGNDISQLVSRLQQQKKIRNSETDFPLTVIFATFGNDVCWTKSGFEGFTSEQRFHDAIVDGLERLASFLPNGSAVVFFGISDGGILAKTLETETHPFGVSYVKWYEYLSCRGMNPCWGWMNNNETRRELTTRHAERLNLQFEKVILERQHLYPNFKIIYGGAPFDRIYKELEISYKLQQNSNSNELQQNPDSNELQQKSNPNELQQNSNSNELQRNPDSNELQQNSNSMNLSPAALIEPLDGFHPSQYANFKFAEAVIKFLKENHEWVLGDINPKNQEIIDLFGP